MQTITSSFLSLNWRDALHGLIMAAIGGAIGVITSSLDAGDFSFNVTAIWHAALVTSLAYLSKKFFTPAQAITKVQ